MSTEDAMEELAESTCWDLLRSTEVGRIAVGTDSGPEIFPVNFAVDHGSVVFRTAPGTKLVAIRSGDTRVAFEADGYDDATSKAWSVVIRGTAGEIRSLAEVADTADLPLQPWHGGPKHIFLRVVPDTVTGRRFVVVDPGMWRTTLSGVRRASED